MPPAAPTSGNYSAAVRASPKFQAKVQASRKPDSQLTGTQRAARAWILKTQTPVTPGSSLSQAALASEAKSAAAEKYAPAQQQAQSNLKSAQQFATNTNDWYRQYQQAAAANAQQVQAANAQANTAIQNLQGGAAPQAGDSTQGAQAAAVRQAMLGSIGALIAGQGANAQRFAGTQANQIAPLQGQQASSAAQGIVSKALDDLKTLALQRGSFLGTYKGQRITDEQRNALAAQTLQGTQAKTVAQINQGNARVNQGAAKVKLQQTTAQQTAAQKAVALKEKQHEFASKTHPGTDVSEGAWRLWGTQGKAGAAKRQAALVAHQKLTHQPKTPKTPAGQSPYLANTSQLRIVGRINDGWHAIANLNPGLTRAEVKTLVDAGRVPGVAKLNTDEFNAAFNLARFKGLTRNNVTALHNNLGIQIKNRWKILPPSATATGNTNLGPGTSSTGAAGNATV